MTPDYLQSIGIINISQENQNTKPQMSHKATMKRGTKKIYKNKVLLLQQKGKKMFLKKKEK